MSKVNFISIEQYLMNRIKYEDLTPTQVSNLNTLIPKVNELLERYGKPLVMSSGFRSKEDQIRIYAEKNAKRKAQGLPPYKVPTSSQHMAAAAVDIEDPDRKFGHWCLMHLDYLIELDLYMEDLGSTPTWCHLQCLPPKSGKRIFRP